jgi:AcrR family transcriptional regulator
MDKTPGMSERRGAREAILAAFRDIMLESGYDGVRVLDVVQRSGVARSTFYEHFQSREDLLLDSMRGPMQLLAQLAAPAPDTGKTTAALEHFAQNRELAKSVLDGESAGAVRRLLAEMISNAAQRRFRFAEAAAGAQLAVITSWLEGRDDRPAAAVATALREITALLL